MKLFGLFLLLAFTFCSAWQAPQVAEKNAPAKIVIANKDEPGERLIVAGKVTGADDKPLSGASVYVFHTDAKGVYTPGPENDNRNSRLRGYMRTDAQGRYEYSTIKPAPYPGNGPPAHIHYVVTAPSYQERIFEIVFDKDPKVTDRIRADATRADSGFSVRPLERDQQGVWRCTQDIKLKR